MTDFHDRLTRLRAELVRQSLDGFVLATGDEHLSEFIAPFSRRLAWLTGFTGTVASAVVLADKAAFFVDSRYTVLARELVDGADWSYQDVPRISPGDWLAAEAEPGARIGYDPMLHTRAAVRLIQDKLTARGASLVPVDANPVDRLWRDQPRRPATPMFIQPLELTGKTTADKRREVADWLAAIGADACVLVALDSIAWLFNVRGADIAVVPVNFAYAILHRDGMADLFVDEIKVGDPVRQHLGNSVRLVPYEAFLGALSELVGKRISVDPARTPAAIDDALEKAGAEMREDRDPTVLARALKTQAEIDGARRAHVRDGAALTRFLHWLSIEAPMGGLDELSAAAKLNGFRRECEGFHSLSFDPISAAGPHGSMPHYWPSEASNIPIERDSLYLIDSGGQYPDGTTDVTRTVAVGTPTVEMKDRFTRVLKGHIALDTAVFPAGTPGFQLDGFARRALWDAGLDYGHGTGHGVGAFLCVHEGPQLLAGVPRADEPLRAGMILSNEPGYYKPGAYGIRIENLMVVVERQIVGAERPMLGFETLTMAPIDRTLIEPGLLTATELDWLDRYHASVREKLGPLLGAETRAWLEQETAPLTTATQAA
jgi:Xaa-Pro aminopeptidase